MKTVRGREIRPRVNHNGHLYMHRSLYLCLDRWPARINNSSEADSSTGIDIQRNADGGQSPRWAPLVFVDLADVRGASQWRRLRNQFSGLRAGGQLTNWCFRLKIMEN